MKLLAIMPETANYPNHYTVTFAASFAEAKEMLIRAEESGAPFDSLDLPVRDRKAFDEFLNWMERRGRKYPFSIFGCNTLQFIRIRDEAYRRGFHFND